MPADRRHTPRLIPLALVRARSLEVGAPGLGLRSRREWCRHNAFRGMTRPLSSYDEIR
jgi:hypothetical protein